MNQSGAKAEEAACRILQEKGYRIVERNYTARFGEIDIIAADGGYLVFVEVKARGRGAIAKPREAVGRSKRKKLVRAALMYLSSHGVEGQPRFDVLELEETEKGFTWEHIENAFGAEEYDAPF